MTEANEITGSEKSLRHALSLHPRAFHVGSSVHRESSQQREPSPSVPTPPASDAHRIGSGQTTAYEPTTPDSESSDPIARSAGRTFDEDVERQSLPRYTRENDPYQLSSKLKSPSEIDLIKANTSKK